VSKRGWDACSVSKWLLDRGLRRYACTAGGRMGDQTGCMLGVGNVNGMHTREAGRTDAIIGLGCSPG
jgi:hypothetical protein